MYYLTKSDRFSGCQILITEYDCEIEGVPFKGDVIKVIQDTNEILKMFKNQKYFLLWKDEILDQDEYLNKLKERVMINLL